MINISQTLVKSILTVFLVTICTTAVAQEYKYEIGGHIGSVMYMGDANTSNLFQDWQASAGVVFRKNVNFRWAMKGDFTLGKIKGSTENTDNAFPFENPVSFSRSFYRLNGQMEFNFLPYSDKFAYLNTSRLSPYVFAGLGLTLAPGDNQTFFGVGIPLGLGVKYKIANRINLGLEFAVNALFGDAFDAPDKNKPNLDNPYTTNSSLFKNKDLYNTLMISVTWDFGPNDRKCSNE